MLTGQRILIYGVTGSGKTSLAARLRELTGLPWTEVDSLTWEPGWIEVPTDLQRERIAAICSQERWILDSAYAKWIDIPLARVDLIIGLDYPRAVSLLRLLRRTFMRAWDKKPICNGNFESWRIVFSTQSILVWHFKSFRRKSKRIREWERDGSIPVLRFTRPHHVERWLQGIATGQDSGNSG